MEWVKGMGKGEWVKGTDSALRLSWFVQRRAWRPAAAGCSLGAFKRPWLCGQEPGSGSVFYELADGPLVLLTVALGRGILAGCKRPIIVVSPRPGKLGYRRHGWLYGEWFDLAAQFAQAKLLDSTVASEELFVEVTASFIGSYDQKVGLAAETA